MSILGSIKQGIKNSGQSKSKILYIKDGGKARIRFLKDVEQGIELTIHDSFENNVKAICLEHLGSECPHCGDDSLRTRTAYFWPVWDQDAKEVKLFEGYPNNFNPLSALVSMYETYGTLLDRDYVISRNGTSTNTSYGVVPMDKVKFKNPKAKPFTEKEVLKILAKAYPVGDDADDEEDEAPKKGKKKAPKKEEPKKKRKPDPEPEEDYEDDYDDEETTEYEDMSPRDLYRECVERGLEVEKKKKAAYYIAILEEDDEEQEDEDWDEDEDYDEDEDEEDEW